MNHLALIADIVGSRKLINRGAVQRRLKGVLDDLNANPDQLASPYTITLGDEFQAVFTGADRLFPDIFAIMAAVHPVELRFSIAVGPLETPINPDQAIGMDGPVFYRARDLLEQMKEQDRVLDVAGLTDADGLLNAALGLFNHQVRKWRANRLDILQRLLQGWEVAAIADHLDITEQSVYKNIREGALESAIQLIHALTGRLNHSLGNAD